ncbi:hypothetical protein SAMN05880501_104135 [Ureibacillus xyleni]|uniref:Branched-chain amino acid aminotransferase n=1 Tax=Ureibacillus xyleni TaxID=614648 RepID=A0A285SJ22_9BACL|nr:hypothetical protein [Ureibacillus xyleni]SOC05899.1 hypothetical protein SAMN05880501_104135 [Ureibacillus xyleni]
MELIDVYIELCDKETEETLSEQNAEFLNKPISYLKQHQNEFLYIESPTFETIKAESLSLELDDVFKTYMVLFGLKVQKKHASTIKTYLNENLHGSEIKNFSAMFSGEDGLWDLNIPIDLMEGFQENMMIEEVLSITINFVSNLLNAIEQNNEN